MSDSAPQFDELRSRLAQEEAAYAQVLAAVDALAGEPALGEKLTALPAQLAKLQELWKIPQPEPGSGLAARHRRAVWNVVQPAMARQEAFNSVLVQLLNGFVQETTRLHDRSGALVAAVVAYMQRVQPMVDARDRMQSALTSARAELILEAFDRRQEEMSRRLEGMQAMRQRLETASEQLRALRDSIEQTPLEFDMAGFAARAMDSAIYEAFENEYRGEPAEIRERLRPYVAQLQGHAPVIELGCGRGEFLELLREAGIEARGVDSNARAVQACRTRGLQAFEADLLGFLGAVASSSLGGIFAAQVAEHLAPGVLHGVLVEAHRTLHPGGLLILETVNVRSVTGLLEVFQRDLSHEKPLHPDTLAFFAAAAGFTDVRVEYLRPVEAAAQLQAVPMDGLPPLAAQALNENIARLNGLLYGPQEFALFATR